MIEVLSVLIYQQIVWL